MLTLEQIVQAIRVSGCAYNGGAGGEHIIVGTEAELVDLVEKFRKDMQAKHDTRWTAMLKRRVDVEQMMFDAARGKRPMPERGELREWALRLGGTPET